MCNRAFFLLDFFQFLNFVFFPGFLELSGTFFVSFSTGTCCIIGFSCCGDSDKYFPQCEKGDVILALFTSTCISDNALQAITMCQKNLMSDLKKV